MKKMLVTICVMFMLIFVGCTKMDVDSKVDNELKSVENYSHTYSAVFVEGDGSEELVIFIVIKDDNYKEIASMVNSFDFKGEYKKITVNIQSETNGEDYKLVDKIILD